MWILTGIIAALLWGIVLLYGSIIRENTFFSSFFHRLFSGSTSEKSRVSDTRLWKKTHISWGWSMLSRIDMQDVQLLDTYSWNSLSVAHTHAIAYIDAMAKGLVAMDEVSIALWLSQILHGHILLQWLPGVAKTTAMKLHAHICWLDTSRIQCTPDMLPSDIVGVEMYVPENSEFHVRVWPIMTNVFLVDEINRMPPKVQSALLEAMQEGHISIGGKSFALPSPFLVIATQNPQDHKGTFPLPEAQLDRFLCSVSLDYLSVQDEIALLQQQKSSHTESFDTQIPSLFTNIQEGTDALATIRSELEHIDVPDLIYDYIVRLIARTREESCSSLLRYWCSPRTSIHMIRMARALAHVQGDTVVNKEHVHFALAPVLRHRLVLSYTAQSAWYTGDMVLAYLYKDIFTW